MLDLIDAPLNTGADAYQLQRQAVAERYTALKAGTQTTQATRARGVAQALGITEAQWVAASCGPIKSLHLSGTGQSVFGQLEALGEVMALTRNDSCVHERHGTYLNIQAKGPMGLVLGNDIDLRVFFSGWQDVFAVQEAGRKSLQFFNAQGVAVHKVYCTERTDMASYLALVQDNVQAHQWPTTQTKAVSHRPDEVTDSAAFRQAWLTLSDTHDFFPMLAKFNVSRLGALSHAGQDLAQKIDKSGVQAMLQSAASSGLAIMCFVGNPGMIQIHTGPVQQIVTRGSWLNVLDPTFNLHLNMDDVVSAWVVNKPTDDGWVTSLEVFDANGELIVQFFGARKPGKPELTGWRDLMASLCHTPLANASPAS